MEVVWYRYFLFIYLTLVCTLPQTQPKKITISKLKHKQKNGNKLNAFTKYLGSLPSLSQSWWCLNLCDDLSSLGWSQREQMYLSGTWFSPTIL